MMALMRYLGTERAFDDLEDNDRMRGETIGQYISQFCKDVYAMYGPNVLNRRPGTADIKYIECV